MGDFGGHKNYYGTTTKDLAMVWAANNNITNIDIHFLGGRPGGPGKRPARFFGLYRAATSEGTYPQYVQWVAGDFNHDGFTDIADAWADNGNIMIDVHENNGGGPFTLRHYPTQGGWVEGAFVAGDFNNDGWDDIAYFWNDNGLINIDVHVNNKTPANPGFTAQRWATGQGGWINGAWILAGQFDGVGGADIAYAWPYSPDLYNTWAVVDVHPSGGSQQYGNFSGPDRWSTGYLLIGQDICNDYDICDFTRFQFAAGDMDGDGLTDITAAFQPRVPGPQMISLGSLRSTGSGFTPEYYSPTVQGQYPDNVTFLSGDFDGDGRGDIADPWENAGNIMIDAHTH